MFFGNTPFLGKRCENEGTKGFWETTGVIGFSNRVLLGLFSFQVYVDLGFPFFWMSKKTDTNGCLFV